MSNISVIIEDANPIDTIIENSSIEVVIVNGIKGDPGIGIPSGGKIKQILSKKSNSDYDTEWQDISISDINNINSTGLLMGGIISKNIDPTKFNISAGAAIIVDNFTDAINPIRTLLTWEDVEFIDIVDPFINESDTTYVNLNVEKQIIFAVDPLTDLQRRSLVAIGWIDHTGETTGVNLVYTEPFYNNSIQSQLNDFIENWGQFNIIGNDYAPLTGLTIERSAGKVFDGNANYQNFKRDPHVVPSELESPVTFYYYYQDPSKDSKWFNDSSATTFIDPNHWDDGSGTLALVPDETPFTIQLISFYSPTVINDVQYGQVCYATIGDAFAALRNPVVINPYNSYDVFRAWLIIKKGCTDLNNSNEAVFRSAGKLGLSEAGSGGIGGSGGEINTASNIGTLGYGLYEQKLGVDLQFKNIVAGNKIIITEDVVHHLLTIALASLSTSDVSDSTDKRYVTDAQLTVIGNTSNTNSGNETDQSIGNIIHRTTLKDTPIDADEFGFWDSVANILKKLTWANIKSVLKTYFDLSYIQKTTLRYNFIDMTMVSWTSGSINGGTNAVSVVATWKSVTNGSWKLSVRGTIYSFTGLNFSSCNTMADVASIIQTNFRTVTGLSNATIVWSTNRFIITDVDLSGLYGFYTYATAGASGTDISGNGATKYMACHSAGTGVGIVIPTYTIPDGTTGSHYMLHPTTGCIGNIGFFLPNWSGGINGDFLMFTMHTEPQNSAALWIGTRGTDKIKTASGLFINAYSQTKGASITLVRISTSGLWVILSLNGTWLYL